MSVYYEALGDQLCSESGKVYDVWALYYTPHHEHAIDDIIYTQPETYYLGLQYWRDLAEPMK